MSMCCRSISLTTVSANRGRAVMGDSLPANSGKSHRSLARTNRCGKRVEHRQDPALVLQPEERLGDLPPEGGRVHPHLHLDVGVVLRRRELEARVRPGHGAAELRLLELLAPLYDPD